MKKDTWENNNTLLREKTYYNAYWYDKTCSDFELVVINALKDAFYRIPEVTVTACGEGADKIYIATIEHISTSDYKYFPRTYLRDQLKKEFPNKKIGISSYTHPHLTLGNYEVTVTLKNKEPKK